MQYIEWQSFLFLWKSLNKNIWMKKFMDLILIVEVVSVNAETPSPTENLEFWDFYW